jgi:tetratricopeptide (TPR) repeat protein
LLLKKYFDESSILTVLSSIEFLKPEDPRQANKHYERGLVFYRSGDILQAQVEFANAYYLSPGNPDYTFMLARSLYLRNQEFLDYTYIKDLLNNVLKIRPDYKEARRLLKEIEPRLPKEAKKLEIR